MRSRSFLIAGAETAAQIVQTIECYGKTLVVASVAEASRALVDGGCDKHATRKVRACRQALVYKPLTYSSIGLVSTG